LRFRKKRMKPHQSQSQPSSDAGLRALWIREPDYWSLWDTPEIPEWLRYFYEATAWGSGRGQLFPARLPVLDVYPDILLAGETNTFYVRGWFPKSDGTWLTDGETAQVTLEGIGTFEGVVVSDDPFNATCVKALKAEVEVPLETAVGLREVTVAYDTVSFTLYDAVHVVRFRVGGYTWEYGSPLGILT